MVVQLDPVVDQYVVTVLPVRTTLTQAGGRFVDAAVEVEAAPATARR
jgi:hypothetical protein